jgi:hypothetical protein
MAMRIRKENVPIATAAAFVVGMFVVTQAIGRVGRARRNGSATRRGFEMPRPVVRVRPKLRVVDGGAPETTALVPAREEADPFHAMLVSLFDADPRGGAFYAIQEGDTPETIARAVLGRVGRFRKRDVVDYIHLMSSSSYNLERYGSPSTSNSYPSEWLVPVLAKGLRAAFLPRNADAIEAIGNRRLPTRVIDPRTGMANGEGSSLAVLWLPPVSPDALREGTVTCSHRSWSDGSSSIDPPPEFFAFMEAA